MADELGPGLRCRHSRQRGVDCLRAVLPVVGGRRRLVADPFARHCRVCHRSDRVVRDGRRRLPRFDGPGLAPARAVARRARRCPDPVGSRDGKIRLATVAVLSAAAIDHRGLHRRSAKTARQRVRLGQAPARRLSDRRDGRLPDRRLDRLVARGRLLGASGAALHRPVAGDRLAADRLLHLSVELERIDLSDRAGNRLPGHRADLVGCREREQRILRRRADARGEAFLPGAEGRDPRGLAARFRRPVHGARLVLCRARRRRDDRCQGRPRLVPAMGAGLGRLRQYVCGADRDVIALLRRDHAAVCDPQSPAGLAKGDREMVAATALAEIDAHSAAGAALDIEQVSHAFDIDGAELPVLSDVSISVEPGEFGALLGPSGCGKSTLLRLVAGLDKPRSGTLREDEARITRPHPSRVVVFQDPTLFPWRTVWDNVALGLEAQGILKSQRHRVDAALDLVGLSSFRNAYPHQLSGGMAQRVALARALVNDPKILILDEPLGKLDSLTRITMQAELVSLWQRKGFTTLLVTHDAEEALVLANRVIVFSDRPARVKADIRVDRPYPRHRGDPYLADLRRQILGLLGLDATW